MVPPTSRGVAQGANYLGDVMTKAVTRNPQATSMRALSEISQMSPVSQMFDPRLAKNVLPSTKVVDENQLPLPVYRGYQSGTGRNKFTFYTSNPELAGLYANKLGGAQYEVTSGGDTYLYETLQEAKRGKKYEHGGVIKKLENAPTVEQSYLDLKNPLVIDAKSNSWNVLRNPFADPKSVKNYEKELASIKKDIRIGGRLYTKEQQKRDIDNKYYFQIFTDTNRLSEDAAKRGFDGIVVKNVYDIPQTPEGISNPERYKSDVFVAFNPQQIKSATSDPDIMAQFLSSSKASKVSPVSQVGSDKTKQFLEMAEKGRLRMAKDRAQELKDLKEGKSSFAELSLNWDDPKTYDLVDEYAKEGFKTKVVNRGGRNVTYLFKDEGGLKGVLSATTPADYGRAYGYPDEDIARFYLERGLSSKDFFEDIGKDPLEQFLKSK
jgi:hypothetical protein